jgi:hypothetical protein
MKTLRIIIKKRKLHQLVSNGITTQILIRSFNSINKTSIKDKILQRKNKSLFKRKFKIQLKQDIIAKNF